MIYKQTEVSPWNKLNIESPTGGGGVVGVGKWMKQHLCSLGYYVYYGQQLL